MIRVWLNQAMFIDTDKFVNLKHNRKTIRILGITFIIKPTYMSSNNYMIQKEI